jgi:hypothetical protein
MTNFNLNKDITPNYNKKKDYKKIEYLNKPGGYRCKITGVLYSKDISDYTGSPFISFEAVTEDGKKNYAKFWTIKDSDKDSTKEWKRKTLKDFLINCGVRDFSDDEKAIEAAKNEYVNICFLSEEYITKDKKTDEPIKRTALRYRWSSKDGAKINYDPAYNKELDQESKKELEKQHDEWQLKFAQSASSQKEDDLPF